MRTAGSTTRRKPRRRINVDVTSVGSTTSADLSQAIGSNNKLNQQEFLKLLVTQLTNQDPMSPQDDKQFLAQMAQFSTVQGVTDLSDTVSRLQSASLIGKTVDAQIAANGQPSTIEGVVKAVSYAADGVHLLVNNQDVKLSDLTKVKG